MSEFFRHKRFENEAVFRRFVLRGSPVNTAGSKRPKHCVRFVIIRAFRRVSSLRALVKLNSGWLDANEQYTTPHTPMPCNTPAEIKCSQSRDSQDSCHGLDGPTECLGIRCENAMWLLPLACPDAFLLVDSDAASGFY